MPNTDFSGVWLSEYEYTSSSRSGVHTGQHYVRAFHEGSHLIFESVPGANKSYVIVRLVVDGKIATGNWEETTDPEGRYKGAIYYGAIQLAYNAETKNFAGSWAGFSKTGSINTGPWNLTYIGNEAPKS